MQDSTATPETGPVDAPASNDSAIDRALAELYADAEADKSDEDLAEPKVKTPEDEGQAEQAPDVEESATDPIETDEEAEEATPETEETDTPPADDPTVKVKVNGEEVEIPLSEALKGYSRTEDYKAKTMALADERRALDQAKATVEHDVKLQYANELKQSIDTFEALDPVLTEARQIDWARLEQEDPATFVKYSRALQDRLALIGEYRAKVETIEREQAETQAARAQAEAAQRFEMAANKLVETMPELAEGDNFSQFATENIGYLRETGYTPEEISEAIDDRALLLADKARKWDALQKAKTALPAKKIVPKSAVKSMTSDASDSSRSSRQRLNPDASMDERVAFALKELKKE